MKIVLVSALAAAGLALAASSAFADQTNGDYNRIAQEVRVGQQPAAGSFERAFTNQTPDTSVSGQRERADDVFSVIRSQRPLF